MAVGVTGSDPTFFSNPAGSHFSAFLPQQDMAAHVDADDMVIVGPMAAPEWETRIGVRSYGRRNGPNKRWHSIGVCHQDEFVEWSGGNWNVEYVVTDGGLRQNFHFSEKPNGTGPLVLHLNVFTTLCPMSEGTTGIAFHAPDGTVRHAYRDLKVWDACGTKLEASLELKGPNNDISIVVHDDGAVYPIIVDPLSTTADRVIVPSYGGEFGFSVTSVGDVNGDGYSDVAVGAPLASFGEAGEGLVYVYYGSAAGLVGGPHAFLQSDQVGAQFGYSVDGAGDVNNDGYSDVVVGATTWESEVAQDKEGAMFVFHGSATGLSTVPAVILQPNAANNYMGYSVAGLGDINGDGFSDVGAGGHLAAYGQSNEGVAWIFLGSATGVNPIFRHRLERNQGAAQFGGSICAAGDVNGDGFNDVIIGAHKFELTPNCPTINTCDDGGIFIYHGSAAALGAGQNPNPTTVFNTAGYSMHTGWSVSTAGDVNGDGYSDVIVGDWRDNIGGQLQEGTAFVFHGSATGVNPTPVTIIQTNQSSSFLGRSVSTAGDVNGDGYADIIVGAPTYMNTLSNEGAAFVHLGSPTGISSSSFIRYVGGGANFQMGESVSTAGDVNGDGYSDMIVGVFKESTGRARVYHGGTYNIGQVPSYNLASAASAARSGWSVANAGDVNGDGYSDAIIGAPNANNGQAQEGVAFIHHGSITGLPVLAARTLEADIAMAEFGKSVASAGDVNGDGYADVVVGAPSSGGIGRVYIHHGSPGGVSAAPALTLNGVAGSNFGASVFKAGDVNGDGYSDVIIGAPGSNSAFLHLGGMGGLNPVAQAILVGPIAGSSFGAAVGTAGDVNGDGFSDVIIGAPTYSNGQANEGALFVYHGYVDGISLAPGFSYESNLTGARVGSSVAGAGDVNGNGFFDIITGAATGAMGQVNEGLVFVFYGTPAGVTAAGATTLQVDQVGANFGTSVAEAGDVNGDGYADVVVGAPFWSNGQASEGGVWVYLGGPGGITTQTRVEVNFPNVQMGFSVAGGGDVDGDGYSDILAGAPYSPPSQDGTVHVFRGNEALSYNRLTRQYLADLVNPISTNSTDFASTVYFGIGHRTRSPIQRTTAKLRWEVVHEGQPYSGAPITNSVAFTANSAAWTDIGLPGFQIKELVFKAPGFRRHKWRCRVEYPMHKMIDGQRFSRWFYGYASAVGDIGILPVELVSFGGMAKPEGNLLSWTTASEYQSSVFVIERGLDPIHLEAIGTTPAAGFSSQLLQYQFMDTEASEGLSYYRLRAVDENGTNAFSDVITVLRDGRDLTIYPVPVDDVLNWSFPGGEAERVQIMDAMGRIVLDVHVTNTFISGRYIQQLAAGSYSLSLLDDRNLVLGRARFLKR